MFNSWHLGRYAGIEVRIHWTFLLLPIWVYYSSVAAGSGAAAATVAVAFVLAVFVCVVLHEYGHALTARRFGIETLDITLLPIGGVARLERMPHNPWQELAIAVAGPAVNVVIAAILFVSLPILVGSALLPRVPANFLANLAWVNVLLVVFNMIPAFPMDGGRVLRALLAFAMPYRSATRVAVGVGRVAAIGLGVVGWMTGNWMMILIAGFVFLAGGAEMAMADYPAQPNEKDATETLLVASGGEFGEKSASLPVVNAQWDARSVLSRLSSNTVDESLVSNHGVAIAVIRKCDLQRAVGSGQGTISIERLIEERGVPFRELGSGTAA